FVASASLVLVFGARRREPVGESLAALAERLAGHNALPLPVAGAIVTPALIALGVSVFVAVGWLLLSPAGHDPSASDGGAARRPPGGGPPRRRHPRLLRPPRRQVLPLQRPERRRLRRAQRRVCRLPRPHRARGRARRRPRRRPRHGRPPRLVGGRDRRLAGM